MANKVRWNADWSWWEIVGDKEWQGEWWRAEQVEKILGFVQWDRNCDMYRVSYGSGSRKWEFFVKFADARAFAKSL